MKADRMLRHVQRSILDRVPELRYAGSGQAVANFSVATDESYRDRNDARPNANSVERMNRAPEQSTLAAFAERYRLRVKRDGCGDPIIPGKAAANDMPTRAEYRNHIYDPEEGRYLAVCLMFSSKMRWTYAKKKLVAAGFVIRRDAEMEGTALFEPTDSKQATVAIRIVGAKAKRRATPQQLANLRKPLGSERALALETSQAV